MYTMEEFRFLLLKADFYVKLSRFILQSAHTYINLALKLLRIIIQNSFGNVKVTQKILMVKINLCHQLSYSLSAEVGKVSLKSNSDETLSDESLKKSNADEELSDGPLKKVMPMKR
jgi:hypothetical protein